MAQVLRTANRYDLHRLTQEAAIARDVLDFAKGPYGNGISLPSAHQLDERFRAHHNNLPFSGALDRCPYMKEIFDGFAAPKASFRLLRRGPKAAYAFHDDKDKGPSVMRFQIPFVTSRHAFLLIAKDTLDLNRFDFDGSKFKGDQNGDVWFDMNKLRQACDGDVELFYLEAGYLHYFDTCQVHTLINAADEERITLSIDVIMNEWLDTWMHKNLSEKVAPSPMTDSTAITWKWNNLRHGIIRTT
jgi:hypothetical protein